MYPQDSAFYTNVLVDIVEIDVDVAVFSAVITTINIIGNLGSI